ncbi:hypothetical protein [Dokdonia sp.]|uniref:hypothetical protein n=1 Tax=Dokdonia sp. TaxID=2024995 RepID=UPI0032663D61
MNVELEYAPDVVIKEPTPEVLEIQKDRINILGTEFLVLINDEGNFIKIKNIRLDESSSGKLTQLLWNLAFINLTIQRSKGQFGHADAKDKTKRALRKILNKLRRCRCKYDIAALIKYIETEGTYINNLL